MMIADVTVTMATIRAWRSAGLRIYIVRRLPTGYIIRVEGQ